MRLGSSWIVLAGLSLPLIGSFSASDAEPPPGRRPDVIYVPTPQVVVDTMLEAAEVTRDDVLYDLGCGDGRIVVAAAERYGARAVGIDIDPKRVIQSRENVRAHGVADLVTIKQADLFREDMGGATVVTLYLVPNLIARLMPKLSSLRPGTRVVSHSFPLKGAKPRKVLKVPIGRDGARTIFLYVLPFEKDDR